VNVTPLLIPFAVATVTLSVPAGAAELIVNDVLSWVVLVTVTEPIVTPVPLMVTDVAPITKFAPVSVTVTLEPACPALGEIELSVGAGVVTGGGGGGGRGGGGGGALMIKPTEFDGALPGFVTLTRTVPALPRLTLVASAPLLRNCVGTVPPPKLMRAPWTKPVPLTVRETTLPVVPEDGETPETVATVFVNASVALFDAPPPGAGLITVMDVDVCPEMDGNVNESAVGLKNDVVTPVPSTCTCEEETNPVPLTVIACPEVLPSADDGFREEITGRGFVMVIETAADCNTSPVVLGFRTTTDADPGVSVRGTTASS